MLFSFMVITVGTFFSIDLSRVALGEMTINSHKLSLECFVEDRW